MRDCIEVLTSRRARAAGSGNEVVTAVVSGSTPVALLALSNMVPHLQSGRIVALAVNAKTRSPLVPDVPTFAEAYGEAHAQTWFGLFAPAGTPKPILSRNDVRRAPRSRSLFPFRVPLGGEGWVGGVSP